ncbi:MAG: phytanoyl-CoA dioxygenase family protein [Chitinophagia bacterium]|nr:phytanoyl-CoA dioxygenase family protein [Chitinophagia bacterium]
MSYRLSIDDVAQYRQDGFLVVKGFFSEAEVGKLYATAVGDEVLRSNATNVTDSSGKHSRLSLWFTPGEDVYGMMLRSERMVDAAARLLDSDAPVCHYHTKLMQKEPRVGGAWEWHQDYGYWYKNQFLFPDQLVSIMIALTPANRENGCLQVIRGSHRMGRVNHGFSGEQVGADMVMVQHALKTMDHVYAELEPGDALFFHSNLLHRSEANLSERPRWSIISCYNSYGNVAYNDDSPSWKVPVSVVPDDALMRDDYGAALAGADFLRKEDDPALKSTGWEKDVRTE